MAGVRYGTGPTNKPGGLKPAQRMDGNSQMAKPSTAGNVTAGPTAPNMHKQPSLQMVLAARKMQSK